MDVQWVRLAQTEPSVRVTNKLEQIAEEKLVGSQVDMKPCKIPPATKSAYHIVLSPNGKFAASAHGDHNVYVCEISSGKLVNCLTGHTRTPWALTYHPINSNLLATGCLAGEVRVWDLTKTTCEVLVVEERSSIASLAFHPEGRVLAIATSDRLIFWDWTEKYPFAERRSPSQKERIRFVKFDRTGCFLYTGITNVGRGPRQVGVNPCIQPHPSLPYRCRELLRNRRELIQMRSDLSRRHAQLLARYTQLLQRYRALQDEYLPHSQFDNVAASLQNELIQAEAAEAVANIPTTLDDLESLNLTTHRIRDREVDLRDITGSDPVLPRFASRARRHTRPLWRDWASQYDNGVYMGEAANVARVDEAERTAADLRSLRSNEEVVNLLSNDRLTTRANTRDLWELDMDRENLSRLTGEVEHLASRLRTIERRPVGLNSTLRGSLARIDIGQGFIDSLPMLTPQEIVERRNRRLETGRPPQFLRLDEAEPNNNGPAADDEGHRRITSASTPTISRLETGTLSRFESQLEPVLPQRPITWAQMMLENPQSDTADRRSIERREQSYLAYPQATVDNRINEQLQQRDLPSTSTGISHQSAVDDLDRPPMSPIQLEGLQDAVAYARDITESSMEVFLRHHRESVARLQRSYLELSGSAQRLVRLFQTTYDDMCRLQDEIDQRVGAQTDRESSRDPARRLLNALINMHDILLKNASDRPIVSEQHRLIYLRQESETLLQVYSTVLENLQGLEFPDGAVSDLQSGRERLEQLLEFSNSIESQNSLDIARLQRTLVDEVHTFQLFVRAWKNMVLSRIQNGTFRLPSQSPEPEASSSSSAASSSRQSSSEVATTPSSSDISSNSAPRFLKLELTSQTSSTNSDDSQSSAASNSGQRTIGMVRLSPMKRKFNDSNCSTPSVTTPSGSGSSGSATATNINLSPLRVTRLNSPRNSVVVSYNNFPFGSAEPASSSTGAAPLSDVVSETDEVSPRKRRRIDFSSSPEETAPTTSDQQTDAAVPTPSAPELMTASEPEPMVGEENSRVPEPTVGSDLHSSQIYRIRRCEQFQPTVPQTNVPPVVSSENPLQRGPVAVGNSSDHFIELRRSLDRFNRASYPPLFQDAANNNNLEERFPQHWERWMSDRQWSGGMVRAARRSAVNPLSRYGFASVRPLLPRTLPERSVPVPAEISNEESTGHGSMRSESEARIRQILGLRDSLRRRLDRYIAPSSAAVDADDPTLEPLAHSPLNEALQEVRNYMRILDRERQELQRQIAARPSGSNTNSSARAAGLSSSPWASAAADVFAWERPGAELAEPFMSDGSLLSLEREGIAPPIPPRRFVPRVRMVHDPEAEETLASVAARRVGPSFLPPPPPPPPPAPLSDDLDLDEDDRESSYDLHRAVNRAIAGTFIGNGDVAIANNILELTARMQQWPYRTDRIPYLTDATANVIVSRCKLHNDGSISISANGEMMATFVESGERKAIWNDTILQIVSLRPTDRGAVLWTKNFGPNAITVSISPSTDHVLVGLASRRNLRDPSSNQTFGQVFKMCAADGERDRNLRLVMTLDHVTTDDGEESMFPGAAALGLTVRTVSLNCALWLSTAGQGFIYASNKGNVFLVTPTGKTRCQIRTIGFRSRGVFLRRNAARGGNANFLRSVQRVTNSISDSSDSD